MEVLKTTVQGLFPELRSCQACDTFPEMRKVCLYVEQTDAKDQTALEASVPVSPKHIVLRGYHEQANEQRA
jgi:hypothetical protein